MKSAIASVCLFSLAVTAAIWSQKTLVKVSDDLLGSIHRVYESVADNDWDSVDKRVTELDEKWEKSSSVISMLSNHTEVDAIISVMASMKQYARYREEASLISDTAVLEKLIKHLPMKERLTIENIM